METSGAVETQIQGIINLKLIRDGKCHTDLTFKNLILDTFFQRYAADVTLVNTLQCRVGSGTTPPTNSDTALVSQIAVRGETGATNNVAAIDVPNNRVVASRVTQFEFTQGAVVGNLGEIGFEFAVGTGGVSGGLLNSRSLVKDSFGTPTVITVTSDDQLVVNYTLQLFTPLIDYTGTVTLGGVTYDVLGRVATPQGFIMQNMIILPTSNFWASFAASTVFGAHGVAPTLNSGGQASVTTRFINIAIGTKDIEITASINHFNASGGIGAICIPSAQGGYYFKYQFTPPIPKTNLNVLKLRFRYICVRA